MDPITATTTIITLATFIKDLIDVGQSIKSSIDKVSENRRQIRDLTDDILRVLAEMAELSRQQAGQSQAPALLSALGDLKADMLYVLAACRKISPAQPSPGFRGFRSQIKVWMKRDDIEAKIRRLKEHVNKCYLEFTAFSAARIEQTATGIKETTHHIDNTTLRVEQSLVVNHVENQVKLQRLEGLMARMLLETQFGQDVMSRTIEIMASDVSHQTLEFKYLSAQTLRLVDLLQDSVAGRPLILDTPLWDGTNLVLLHSTSPDHVLYQILAVIFAIKESHAQIQFSSIEGILSLGSKLGFLGMNPEGTAWELMISQILRHLPGNSFHPAPGILPNLAFSSHNLSRHYQYQLRWDLATETSQRAMDMCRLWQELSPDVYHRSLLGTILITHSENLRMTGRLEVAISIAEEAVAVFRGMAVQLVEAAAEVSCWGEPDDWKAVKFSAAFFAHAAALASAERHVAAYEAAKEGFQTVLRFPKTQYPPPAKVIDTFIDQLCYVAEGGRLSLGMLADDMILFRDLARVYPEQFSTPFLHHLHAYMYMSQQESPDFRNLRIFLEPNSASSTPVLDPSRELKVHNCSAVIKDVIRAHYYFRPWPWGFPLIENIFIAHFDQAVAAFREVASNLVHDQHFDRLQDNMSLLFYNLSNKIFPLVTRAQKLVLVEIMAEIVGHLRTGSTALSYQLGGFFSLALWNAGFLNDAIALCNEAVEYLRCSPSDKFEHHGPSLDSWLLHRTFILWDMGQISQAIEAARLLVIEKTMDSLNRLDYYMIRKQILQRTGRNWEAVKLLRDAYGEAERLRVEDPIFFGLIYSTSVHFLLADLAAARRLTGQLGKAVEDAERAVAACREDVGDMETQKHGLVYSLTTLSNCLAGVGRNDEALVAAEEAASTYSLHAPRMWGGFMNILRREELGANAFHALSLRLVASGQLEAALLNAERATELYRESVSLAPRHLPTLASRLQNLASILWNLGHRDQSISTSDEAVSIMRKVADSETYFLGALGEALDQLTGYLAEKGDTEGAAAATSESAEVQRRMELLPPESEFLFSPIETESDSEDDDQEWETATESEEEYHDAAVDVEVAGLDPASAITSQDLSLSPPILSDSTETQSEQNGIPWAQAPIMTSKEQATIPPVTSQYEDHISEDIAKPEMSPPRAAAILSTPLKVKLHLQLRSTPVDILWWILVAVLGIALAAVWSRE
ncbi:hypothetical protein DFH09DRAFT_1375914 [Mycena vulgaris]|nr:hypothetical protein DFH09DRAFT_1375914 [Mycena vulgaris]